MSNTFPVPSNVTSLQSAVKQGATSNLAIYSEFLPIYFNKKFLTNLINSLTYQADLTLVLPSSNNIEIFTFLKQFIYSLLKDLKEDLTLTIPKKHYIVLLEIIRKLIELREDVAYSFVNYDNLLERFNTSDQYALNILQDVVDNPILDNKTFKILFDNIIQDIQIYNQMQVAKNSLFKWSMFVNDSNNELTSSNSSALNWVKQFKDAIVEANSGLSELTILQKNEHATDYLVFFDKDSVKESLSSIFSFLKTSYRTYKTGYSLFDDNISGIESSSVTVIAGPSNHAKSIFMLNLAKSIMELNETKDEIDTFIFVTLEDDINKLFRRILSIFGNYDVEVIKKLFTKTSEILQNAEYQDILGKDVVERVKNIVIEITEASILSVTQGKKQFIIKHSSENSFSMGDASRFIDTLELSGHKVRGLFIDYLDVMTPTSIKQNKQFVNDEYITQGMIMHEMRLASRRYGIPIITITQNNRLAENFMVEMSNNLVGDSIKKVRYSDNIVMIRQRADLDIFSEQVAGDVNGNNKVSINDSDNVYLGYVTPFEAKITKAKDGGKGDSRFHIFSSKNLKICETVEELIYNHKHCIAKSEDLLNQLSMIGLSNIDIDNEILFDENDPFDNLIL